MPRETIFLYHTPIDKAIDYLVSDYGFKPAKSATNQYTSIFYSNLQSGLGLPLRISHKLILTIETEGKFQKLSFSVKKGKLIILVTLTLLMLTLFLRLYLNWYYVVVFIPLLFVIRIYSHTQLEIQFSDFCEKLKDEIINPLAQKP